MSEPLFGRRAVFLSLIQGLVILATAAGVYRWAMGDHGGSCARCLAFMTLVLSNLALIFTNRSATRFIPSMLSVPNAALWWISGCTVAMLALVMISPFFQGLFQFQAVPLDDLGYCLSACALCTVVLESLKLRPFQRNSGRGGSS